MYRVEATNNDTVTRFIIKRPPYPMRPYGNNLYKIILMDTYQLAEKVIFLMSTKKKQTTTAYTSHNKHPVQLKETALGKSVQYDNTYNPDRLCAIARAPQRNDLGITGDTLPFYGKDYWHHYEVSWLTPQGKPAIAMAHINYDCHSPCLVESKSLKLYFNSLNSTSFASTSQITHTIQNDLENTVGVPVNVVIQPLYRQKNSPTVFHDLPGHCIDTLDITCETYTIQPHYLTTTTRHIEETLHSHLFKSNCPVTGQPDWGSICITYQGQKIDPAGLLRYLVSFRHHAAFHEQCIEKIFMDIMTQCQPCMLTVCGHYTRRGGIDINPYRSTHPIPPPIMQVRLMRQ